MIFKEIQANQDVYKGAIRAAQEYMYCVGKAGRRITKPWFRSGGEGRVMVVSN